MQPKTEFPVEVRLVVSDRVARAWRAPDDEYPEGRAYGVLLEWLRDADGRPVQAKRGMLLLLQVDSEDPRRAVGATVLEPSSVGVGARHVAEFA